MSNDIKKTHATELERIIVQKAEAVPKRSPRKSKPGEAPGAWLWRYNVALGRILDAVSEGAEAAGKKALDDVTNNSNHYWGARVRASRTRDDVVYFEILETVGRAAEAAAARAAGYKTWAAYKAAKRANWTR